MSPAGLAWLYRLAVLVHVAGVAVWMGAVSYQILILRPATKASGLEREAVYALHRALKRRIRVVVGAAVVAIVVSGFFNAWLRGLLGGGAPPLQRGLFHLKLALAALLILVFLFTFRVLATVKTPKRRGRLYIMVHWVVLAIGTVAAALGVLLSR